DLDARGLAALGPSDEVRQSRHRDATGLAGAARGMLAQRDDAVIHSLEAIRVPTLVLVGANDTNFLAATDYMARKIAGSTKVVLPDAGHAANLHQPSAFNHAMATFLAGLARCGLFPGILLEKLHITQNRRVPATSDDPPPLTQIEIDQRVFDLYDEYCHGRMHRREFLTKSAAVTAGGLAMAQALLP